MAGGIDWFRWHHGSVTDPKFQLVAKKAGVRLGDVIAVWAFVLEKASADVDRGTIGQIDFETLDFLLGTEEGTAARILDAMTGRGLLAGSRVARWEERQPKREDDTAAERKRRQREREHELALASCPERSHEVTEPSRSVTQGHDRGEERREERKTEDNGLTPGFQRFWDAWPKSERKAARGKCFDSWKKAKADQLADTIVAHVESLKRTPGWTKDGGQYIPAPLVYLNERRWEGADPDAANDDPWGLRTAL
jgi:hypothetical protein